MSRRATARWTPSARSTPPNVDKWRARRDAVLRAAPMDVASGDGPLDPERALDAAERRRVAREALAQLAERDRVALLMRQDGFSHAEIAAALGTTPKSVGQVLARAIERLARALGARVREER